MKRKANLLLPDMGQIRVWTKTCEAAYRMRIYKQLCQSNSMKQNTSSRFFGTCVIAATLLFLIMMAALHLLRPDYNPLRNFMSEYLVGPFGFLGTAAVFMLAATFLMLLAGLRLSVCSSGFLTVSCVLLGVMVISACVVAVFPIDVLPPDGSLPPTLTRAAIIHIVFSALLYVSLIALLLTLPSAYKRDEKWRPFSHVTLFLGFLILASVVGLILAPFYLRGLAQRGSFLVILVWLLLTGLRLRQAIPESFVKAALLFVMAVSFAIFVASGVFRILSSFTPLRTDPYLYWGLVVLCFAMGTFSFWRSIVELLAYLREQKMESNLR